MIETTIEVELPEPRPAYFCQRCGWSEDPANATQIGTSDPAFHAPCPATAGDPGLA